MNERSGLLPNTRGTEGYQSIPPPPSSPPKQRSSAFLLILLAATMFAGHVLLCRDSLDPASREAVRKQWDQERWAHQGFVNHTEVVRAEWLVERQEHDRQRSLMVGERLSWQVEREEQGRKLSELRRRIEQERLDWDAEKRDRERNREEYEREMERKRQREDAERRKREEEDRSRAGLRWETLVPEERCLRYGTREYTARLSNIPQGYDKMKGCRETEAEIHGNSVKPDYCEDQVSCPIVYNPA